jgi:hypothetical protein
MSDRSGISDLQNLREELNSALDRIIDSKDSLPSLSSLDSPATSLPKSVLEARPILEEILALLKGSHAVHEFAWSVRPFPDLFPPSWTSFPPLQYHVPSALRLTIETHVVETLREAAAKGKKALSAEELAKSSTVDPAKLGPFSLSLFLSAPLSLTSAARVFRLLAAHHVFVETEPDSFALNRPALFLDTGKSVEELKACVVLFSSLV